MSTSTVADTLPTTPETPVHPDDLNRPRCDSLEVPEPQTRCLAQGAGSWRVGLGSRPRDVVLCEDHRLSLEEQVRGPLEPWVPFHPPHVQARTAYMLERMAAGAFG